MSEYPEHDKLSAVSEDSQTIGAFLDNCGFRLCEVLERGEYVDGRPWDGPTGWYPVGGGIEKILAAYFDIDLDKIEGEKQAMLATLRGNTDALRAAQAAPVSALPGLSDANTEKP